MSSKAAVGVPAVDSLVYLVYPGSAQEFIQRTWEASPLHVTHRPSNYFDAILGPEELADILSRDNLFYPAIQIFHNGIQLRSSCYTHEWGYGRESYTVIDGEKVLDWFDRGATVNILGLERMSPGIQVLNASLEAESGFPVHTTGFLTPASVANIPPHYDEVDFFVLQTRGTKLWRLWESNVGLPLVVGGDRTYPDDHPALHSDRLIAECVLSPGDTLYVPRGVIHETRTNQEISFHITVGINPHRLYDALTDMVEVAFQNAAKRAEFRRSVPAPNSLAWEVLVRDRRAEFDQLLETFKAIIETTDESRPQLLDERMLSGRYCARRGQLVELSALNAIKSDTVIRRRVPLVAQVFNVDDRVIIRFHGKSLSFPKRYAHWIGVIERGEPLSICELPGPEDESEKVAFVRHLVAEGYVSARF